jgi:hypothetical protein
VILPAGNDYIISATLPAVPYRVSATGLSGFTPPEPFTDLSSVYSDTQSEYPTTPAPANTHYWLDMRFQNLAIIPPVTGVFARFTEGSGTAAADQYAGSAGNGWLAGWATSAANAGTVEATTPLGSAGGNYLKVVRSGGTSGQEGVNRRWSTTVRPYDEFNRITCKLRLDSLTDKFNTSGDMLSISDRDTSPIGAGNETTFYMRAFGGATGSLQAREWGVFNGDPGQVNAYDVNRFLPTGVFLTPGHIYTFTIDAYAAAASGTTGGRPHGTYDVTISTTDANGNPVGQPRTVTGLGFRSDKYALGGYLSFSTQQSATTDNLAFSVDSIEIQSHAATPLRGLEIWRRGQFSVTTRNNPALESTLWGNLADPDGDGMPNLLEYAFSSNPNSAAVTGLPVIGKDLSGQATLTFTRVADPLLTYEVLGSDELATWSVVWSSSGTANIAGSVTATDNTPLTGNQRFLRLRVSTLDQ